MPKRGPLVRRHQFSACLLCAAGFQQGKEPAGSILRTDIDRRTNGAKRRREGIRKATDVLVEMVAEATASGIQASHLLFDSWFAYPATMRKLLAKGMHTLCMLKVTEKIFYHYQGKDLHLAAIYRKIRKRRGRAKILASVTVEMARMTRGALYRQRLYSSGTGAAKSGWPCCPPIPPWAMRRSSRLINADGTSRCSSRLPRSRPWHT